MKTNTILLALALAMAFPTSVSANLFKEQHHTIYHVAKNKTLLQVTNQLANRSGISFEINADVEQDLINRKLAAANWTEALNQLLEGYNFSVESLNDKITTVVISGRNGSGNIAADSAIEKAKLIVVQPESNANLPEQYRHFNQGSVMNVALPMDELRDVASGDDFVLDLPIGQYTVRHDSQIEHEDGSSTWMGYLGDEGKGYRIYLSEGDAGVIGNVYTPDGAYNIETVNGQTVIVDVSQSGLANAGLEHDEVEPIPGQPATMNNPLLSMNSELDNLQIAAEQAKANAETLASQAETLLADYQQAIADGVAIKSEIANLKSELRTTKAQLTAVRKALATAKTDTQLGAQLAQFTQQLKQIKNELRASSKALRTTLKAIKLAKAGYKKKLALAKAAQANALQAQASYEAQKSGSNDTVANNSSDKVIVDLMVLYTTENQTADYAKQRIQYLVDVSNQAYQDSGINMRLRLVHTQKTHYSEASANATALFDLANDNGAFAGTAALRNQYGADLVVLFRPLHAATAGSCGTTYVGFANGGDAQANTGFGTIGDGYSKDEDDSFFCGSNTFTHELGHSFGTVHDREYSSFAGKFDYSYAWGVDESFGTIMSYKGPALMLFATPDLSSECAGAPCGFAEGDANASDQAKTINYTAPLVAAYRPTTVSVPVIE
ncbi:reprolysin-like metallopeptidase [Methylomonas rhizoryzae]|uniref:reprolysin-like metallopeptidase n=1 Tax=Methylomonas rhizoryzae TaxID=2608981 RepID=UPI0012319768|nr:zinc-dependent metalloprotease family protein [Methylomonas rhizoryzae]